MAIINQSPANQTSLSVSNISFSDIVLIATPYWQSRKIVESASVETTIGDTGASSLPTTGQIWPSKL